MLLGLHGIDEAAARLRPRRTVGSASRVARRPRTASKPVHVRNVRMPACLQPVIIQACDPIHEGQRASRSCSGAAEAPGAPPVLPHAPPAARAPPPLASTACRSPAAIQPRVQRLRIRLSGRGCCPCPGLSPDPEPAAGRSCRASSACPWDIPPPWETARGEARRHQEGRYIPREPLTTCWPCPRRR